MNRIAAVEIAATAGRVKELLEGVHKGLGMTPNLFRVAAQSPATLEALVSFFGAVGKDTLGAKTREAIALTVSEFDACDYCLSAHTALGKAAGLTDVDVERARRGTAEAASLDATLRFARSVTEKRGRVGAAEVAAIRAAGVGDAQILEVIANVALTTLTNYINEVAATDIDFPVVRHAPR